MPPDQLKALQEDRTGCLVGALLARNKGWKIGSKIPLKGDIYPSTWNSRCAASTTARRRSTARCCGSTSTISTSRCRQAEAPGSGNAGIVVLRAENDDAT